MIREAEIEEMGIKIGGKFVLNLRYADDTALFAKCQEEAERLIGKVNNMDTLRWLNISNISAQLHQLMAIVATIPDPELEWPRKECSILYRSGKTEE